MIENPNDSWLVKQIEELRGLLTANPLRSASVDRGRVRMMDGSELLIEGLLSVIGRILLQGDMEVTGDGKITVGGVVITPLGGGRIQIGPNIVLDAAMQKIAIGDDIVLDAIAKRITIGGSIVLDATSKKISIGNDVVLDAVAKRITIGQGSSQIILDTTQFKVGAAFRMDPAHSTTGAQMEFGPNRLGRIFGDDNSIVLTVMEGGSALAALSVVESFAFTGIDVLGEMRAADLSPLPAGEAYDLVVRSRTTNKLHVHAGGTGGGPGDGIFAWPFPLDQVTSEFRSAERPDHDGIDFGIGPSNTAGTPIPAMGAAVVHTILAEGQGHGWGNGVVLDHGTDPIYNGGGHNIKTLYAHMSTPPVVGLGDAVALGQELGPIGNTGNSFGNHLHLEVWVDDVPVNPRDFMAQHGG